MKLYETRIVQPDAIKSLIDTLSGNQTGCSLYSYLLSAQLLFYTLMLDDV